MDEKSLTQRIIGLLHLSITRPVELDRHTHPHVLRTLPDTTVATLEHVAVLKRLETKVLKHEVTRVVDHFLKLTILRNTVIGLGDHPLIKQHLCGVNQTTRCLLLVVINHQTCGQLTVVRVVSCLHHRTDLGSELVELRSLDAVLDLVADLLRDQIRVHMRKSVCEFLDPIQNLVEGHRDAVAIALCDVNMIRHLRYCIPHPYS